MANRKSRVASGHERDVIPLLSHLDDLERVAAPRGLVLPSGDHCEPAVA
jgi:hypothetical protein